MCSRYSIQTKHEPVPSLLNICVEHLISNIETNTDVLPFLPTHIKNRILRRIACLSLKYSNIKCLYRQLVHAQVKQIDYSTTCADNELLHIISKCYNLRELTLTGLNTHNLTETGLIEILPNFKNLLIFQAPNCSAITDKVVATIVENCPQITGLDLSACENMTDISLTDLSKLSNLTALNISKTKITTSGIISLSEGNSNTVLKELRIALCNNITDKAIQSICDNCPSLEVLIFYNCAKINDQTCVNMENDSFIKLKQLTWTVYW